MKKRVLIIRVIIFTYVTLFASGISHAGKITNAPAVFTMEIGGMEGSQSVQLKNGTLLYSARNFAKETDSAKIIPTQAQWNEFYDAMEKLKVWQWSPNYINNDILDGAYWELEIQVQGRHLKIFGRNSYPQADGKPGEYGETFRAYLKAVEKLLGGKRFT